MAITVAHGVNTIGASFAAGVGKSQQRQNELAAKQREAELERVARQRAQQQQMQFTAQRDIFGAQQQTLRDQRLFGQQAQRDQQIFDQQTQRDKQVFDQQAQRDERLFGQQTQRDELEAKRAQDRLDSEWGYRTKQQDKTFGNKLVDDRIAWLDSQESGVRSMGTKPMTPEGKKQWGDLMNERAKIESERAGLATPDYLKLREQWQQRVDAARLGDHIMVDPAKAKAEYDADYTRRKDQFDIDTKWSTDRNKWIQEQIGAAKKAFSYTAGTTEEEVIKHADAIFGKESPKLPAYEFHGVQQPQAPSQPAPQLPQVSSQTYTPEQEQLIARVSELKREAIQNGNLGGAVADYVTDAIGEDKYSEYTDLISRQQPLPQAPSQQSSMPQLPPGMKDNGDGTATGPDGNVYRYNPQAQAQNQPQPAPVSPTQQPQPGNAPQPQPSGLPSGLDINSLPKVSPEDLQGLPGGSYFRIPDAYGGGVGQIPMQQQPQASPAQPVPSTPQRTYTPSQQPTQRIEQLSPYQQMLQDNRQQYEQEMQLRRQGFSGQQGYGDAASRQDAMIKQVIRGGGFDQSNSRGTGDGKPQWSLNTERPKGHGLRFSDMEIEIRRRNENGIPLTEEMKRWLDYGERTKQELL